MEDTENNIVRQDIKKFTVQLRDYRGGICGTGFVISRDHTRCLIVTCRHVVEAAREDGQCIIGVPIEVYFPQIEESKIAQVLAYPTDSEDDIAILELRHYISKRVKFATVATFDTQYGRNHKFSSFGYRQIADMAGLWASGQINGEADTLPDGRKLKTKVLQLNSDGINGGMSGAPVFDENRNLVIGIISEKYHTTGTIDPDLAFAVDCAAIVNILPEFEVFTKLDNPLEPYSQPVISDQATKLYSRLSLDFPLSQPLLHDAPQIRTWAERPELLASLWEAWNNPGINLVNLYGFAGDGKSLLARKWIDEIIKLEHLDAIIWLNVSKYSKVDILLDVVFDYLLSDRDFDLIDKIPVNRKIQLFGKILIEHNILLILDGCEIFQEQRTEHLGEVVNPSLKTLLEYFLGIPNCQSTCIVTTRLELAWHVTSRFKSYYVGSLEPAEAVNWLIGQLQGKVTVKTSILHELVKKWESHPLILSLIAADIIEKYRSKYIESLKDIPQPQPGKSIYQNIQEIIDSYFEKLSVDERETLALITAFPDAVDVNALYFVQSHASNLINKSEQSLIFITNKLFTRRLLRKTAKGDYYVHPVIADVCNNLRANFSKDKVTGLRFDMARYHFSQISPEYSKSTRKHARYLALYNLYSAIGIFDKGVILDLEMYIKDIKKSYRLLPEGEYVVNGKYILIHKLGSGLTGDVWLAYQHDLSRLVALKFLKEAAKEFTSEMDELPKLVHPSIITVFQREDEQLSNGDTGRIFIVMPYHSGGTLEDRMKKRFERREAFTPSEVYDFVSFIAGGLDYMHGEDIIHEDLKPDNIVFSGEGKPIIVDFGFARVRQVTASDEAQPGSPRYLSPEKWEKILGSDQEIDGRSDQYSVAVIVYEMLTGGNWPYGDLPSGGRFEWANASLEWSPLSINQWQPTIPVSVNNVVLQALSRDPNNRYETMQDFTNALAEALEQNKLSTPADSPTPDINKRYITDYKKRTNSLLKRIVFGSGIVVIIFVLYLFIMSAIWPVPHTSTATATPNVIAIQATNTKIAAITAVAVANMTDTAVYANSQAETSTVVARTTQAYIAAQMTTLAETSAANTHAANTQVVSDVNTTSTAAQATSQAETNTSIASTTQAYIAAQMTTLAETSAANTHAANTQAVGTETVTPAIVVTEALSLTLSPTMAPTLVPAGTITTINQMGRYNSLSFTIISATDPQCLETRDEQACDKAVIYVAEDIITIGQYRKCWNNGNGACDIPNNASEHFYMRAKDLNPVVDISWEMAYTFCNTYGGRLPTEQEWLEVVSKMQLYKSGFNELTSPTKTTTEPPESIAIGVSETNSQRTVVGYYYNDVLGFRCVFEPILVE